MAPTLQLILDFASLVADHQNRPLAGQLRKGMEQGLGREIIAVVRAIGESGVGAGHGPSVFVGAAGHSAMPPIPTHTKTPRMPRITAVRPTHRIQTGSRENGMARNIGALVVGLLVGMLLNAAVVQLSSTLLYPMPAGLDPNDPAQLYAYIETLPVTAFVMAIVAHVLQAGAGGWLAARLCASRPLALAGAIGAITVAGSIYNLRILPAPAWMWLEVPLLLVVSWQVGQRETALRASAQD